MVTLTCVSLALSSHCETTDTRNAIKCVPKVVLKIACDKMGAEVFHIVANFDMF